MPKKKKALLRKEDCQSIAGMFADDLIAYHKAGGSLKNLTAKKVYKKLRDEKAEGDDFSVEEVYAELDELRKRLASITPEQLEKYKDDETVDLNIDVTMPEQDQNYLLCSLFHVEEKELEGTDIGKQFSKGHYQETPKFLLDYEIREFRKLMDTNEVGC